MHIQGLVQILNHSVSMTLPSVKIGTRRLLTLVSATAVGTCAAFVVWQLRQAPVLMPTQPRQAQEIDAADKIRHVRVIVHKSRTLRLDQIFDKALAGSPEIIDSVPTNNQVLHILGKRVGATDVSVLDSAGKSLEVFNIEVVADTGGLQDRFRRERFIANKSRTVRLEKPFKRAVVGAPEIIEALPTNSQTLYIQGKNAGRTDVATFDDTGQLLEVIDIEVVTDTNSLVIAPAVVSNAGIGNSGHDIVLQLVDAFDALYRKDYATTLRLLRPLAEQGNAGAQNNLGIMYDNGQGVPRNDGEAAKWYRKAADQGNVGAQFSLGIMYANGRGVPKDYVNAYKWLNLSAQQGNRDAEKSLRKVVRLMTQAQLAEVQNSTPSGCCPTSIGISRPVGFFVPAR